MSLPPFRRKLVWLIALRVIFCALMLGSGTLVQVVSPGAFPTDPFFLLIEVTLAMTLLWVATLGYVDRHRWLVDLQLGCDSLGISAFIYFTGGVTSYFQSLYVLPIIAGSVLGGRRAGLFLAMLSSLLYAALGAGQYLVASGVLVDPWRMPASGLLPPPGVAGYVGAINVCGFFVSALLSGSLAETLRHTGERLEQASTEIADLQAFNQHVIDSLTHGLVTTDVAGRVLTFNPAAEAITGQGAATVIGRPVVDVLQLPEEFAAAVGAGLPGVRSRRADFAFRRPDARPIDLGLAASHLLTSGERTGLLFTFQDVTVIRKLERDGRRRQRLAAVGEMAAGIAHEIRNPLASMSGSIQILRQELSLSEEQAQLMDIVLRESDRLNQTIRSFLAYARPQRFAVARVDLRRAISESAMLLRNSAEVGDGHLIEVVLPEAEVWYDADENQIRQVVWNLATNGLKAMPQGGRLRIAAARLPREGEPGIEDAELRVEDEGLGIAPEQLDGIFEPFNGSFARGSGLGLAIVHRIVTDYGGEIRVTSQVGRGTCFSIRLPAQAMAVA